ncbi:hypothetical protein [Halobiforma nitratireducens]|uniref:Uncharacterized protein n=1 Tax=Halobiforma nitratireducens JCM 10879 TaxID=1227454 RepID=M0M5A1_9EURY|nr:hypothetical protein [Halobiforma nitratireducens]EMA39814.1 hypothetical protein C446_07829 [Halobiforma nitratireducens JCM 10879]
MTRSRTESGWLGSTRIFEEPSGWPVNALVFLLAATSFTVSFVRGNTVWMTLGWIFVVLAVAESVPSGRTTLAGAVRIGGLGLVVLAAIAVDSGLVT